MEVGEVPFLAEVEVQNLLVKLRSNFDALLSKGEVNEIASNPKDTVKYVKISDPVQQQEVHIEHHFDEESGTGSYSVAIIKNEGSRLSLSEYNLGTAGFKEENIVFIDRKTAVIHAGAKNSLDRAHFGQGIREWLKTGDSYIDKVSPNEDINKVELQGLVDFSSRLMNEGQVQSTKINP